MKKAIYPGSFDPITNGHLDIIERASAVFDKLIVAVANNPSKNICFDINTRLGFLEEVTRSFENVEIDTFDTLLVDYVAGKDANVIVRGLRAVSDFEMEFQMALINKKLLKEVETVFLVTSTEYSYLSSSIIKEVAMYGGDVRELVPPRVWDGLKKKYDIGGPGG